MEETGRGVVGNPAVDVLLSRHVVCLPSKYFLLLSIDCFFWLWLEKPLFFFNWVTVSAVSAQTPNWSVCRGYVTVEYSAPSSMHIHASLVQVMAITAVCL